LKHHHHGLVAGIGAICLVGAAIVGFFMYRRQRASSQTSGHVLVEEGQLEEAIMAKAADNGL
jgi:hypothetical protein